MTWVATPLPGVFVHELDPIEDERGFFARHVCAGDDPPGFRLPSFDQFYIAYNRVRNTVRGMHWQAGPHAETKVVRCTRGSIYDVAVDIRRESPTFGKWFGVELSAVNGRSLIVPEGFAHGYQTLEDQTEVHYMVTPGYDAASARGLRWDDPAVGITWPMNDPILSERDRTHPFLDQLS